MRCRENGYLSTSITYVLTPNWDRSCFAERQTRLNYMERLIRLPAGNREIKIEPEERKGVRREATGVEKDRFPRPAPGLLGIHDDF